MKHFTGVRNKPDATVVFSSFDLYLLTQMTVHKYFKSPPKFHHIFNGLTITTMYLKACFIFLSAYALVLLPVNTTLSLSNQKAHLLLKPALLKSIQKKKTMEQFKYSEDYSVTKNLHQF